MNQENNQQENQNQPIKKPSFFKKLFSLGSSKASGVLKQQGKKTAVKLAKKAGLKTVLTSIKGILTGLPEGTSKLIAAALTVLEKVGSWALIKLKKALKRPDKTLYAAAGMIMLPIGILIGGGIGTVLIVGGGSFMAASTIAHLGSKAVGFIGTLAGKGFSLAFQQPANFLSGVFTQITSMEIGTGIIATPTFGSIAAIAGTGAITIITLASAFYVPGATRLSPWQEKSQYISVKKQAFFVDENGAQTPISDGQSIDNDKIKNNTSFVYSFTITATGADLTNLTAFDLTSSYQEMGEYIASDLSWQSGEIPDLPNGNSWTSPQYEIPTAPIEKFQDAMLANQVSVNATALITDKTSQEQTALEQISFDNLAIIIGTPKTGCPVATWPVQGTITQRPNNSAGTTHYNREAIDIAATIGTPIKATANGVFSFGVDTAYDPVLDREIPGYGNYVKITTVCKGQPLSILYAHLDGFNSSLQSGQSVAIGQIIGYVGNTGNSTGPHLHYEFQSAGNIIKMAPPYTPSY